MHMTNFVDMITEFFLLPQLWDLEQLTRCVVNESQSMIRWGSKQMPPDGKLTVGEAERERTSHGLNQWYSKWGRTPLGS